MPERTESPPATGLSSSSRLLLLAAIGVPVALAIIIGLGAMGSGGLGSASPSPTVSTSSASPSVSTSQTPDETGALIRDDSPTLGPDDAPVTLVEFLDPECEACRAYHPTVKQLMADYDGQIRLVVRYVPGHANSALAAIALEAAREQDEDLYWQMLDLLFERQPEWGEQQEPQPQAFLDAAAAVGLDPAPIQAAMTEADTSMVERDLADTIAAGVQGTPTFFVNGTQVTDQSPEGLRAAIEAALGG